MASAMTMTQEFRYDLGGSPGVVHKNKYEDAIDKVSRMRVDLEGILTLLKAMHEKELQGATMPETQLPPAVPKPPPKGIGQLHKQPGPAVQPEPPNSSREQAWNWEKPDPVAAPAAAPAPMMKPAPTVKQEEWTSWDTSPQRPTPQSPPAPQTATQPASQPMGKPATKKPPPQMPPSTVPPVSADAGAGSGCAAPSSAPMPCIGATGDTASVSSTSSPVVAKFKPPPQMKAPEVTPPPQWEQQSTQQSQPPLKGSTAPPVKASGFKAPPVGIGEPRPPPPPPPQNRDRPAEAAYKAPPAQISSAQTSSQVTFKAAPCPYSRQDGNDEEGEPPLKEPPMRPPARGETAGRGAPQTTAPQPKMKAAPPML
mmetsp:Transcript_44044/g.101633  ORF Transcript_44044/g.101633 Transcript_44044/m.101633 type:complete len:368 (+) Transcript_44044:100-1203(+)